MPWQQQQAQRSDSQDHQGKPHRGIRWPGAESSRARGRLRRPRIVRGTSRVGGHRSRARVRAGTVVRGNGSRSRGGSHGSAGSSEWVAGRNAVVVEALHADSRRHDGCNDDADRTRRSSKEALRIASARGLTMSCRCPVHRSTRQQAKRLTRVWRSRCRHMHAHPDDLVLAGDRGRAVAAAGSLPSSPTPGSSVLIVRSAAAFGVHGVVVPERRAAGMTASASGRPRRAPASRVPVARGRNAASSRRTRAAGCRWSGSTPAADMRIEDLETAVAHAHSFSSSARRARACLAWCVTPATPWYGSRHGRSGTESLNAAVAAGVALYEIARRRSMQP